MRTLLFTCLTLLCAAPAWARTAAGSGYSVSLEDEYGRGLQTFQHRGNTYVMGTWGHRYNVRVRNHTGHRIEAVVSVDGRDVVSGRAGDYVAQRGYIIAPYDSVVIEGFRQTNTAVASFRFTSPGDSYSARMGTPQNVGVIGVAVFRERNYRRRPKPMAKRKAAPAPPPRTWWGDAGGDANDSLAGSAAESAPSRDMAAAPKASRSRRPAEPQRQNIGTQYGETRYSEVVEVVFKRRNKRRPDRVLQLYYDDVNGLQAKGVPVYPPYPPYYSSPAPFPNREYAPPPPR